MSNPYREDVLIVKLREGLYEAIQESSDVDVTDIDSITFQKLLLEAIEHFDLREDITTQWYLDGEMIGDKKAKQEKFGDKSRLAQAHQFHLSQTPSVDDVASFYKSMENPSFSTFVRQHTFEYLREYYSTNERIPYRELYLKNLDIDRAISRAENQLLQGDSPTSAGEKIRNHCQEFKLELLQYQEFSDIMPYENVFERAAVTILRWTAESEQVDSDTRASLLAHCDEFYYEGLWRAIACIISRQNVSGPSENQVKKRRLGELSAHREVFKNRYQSLREDAREAGLELDPISVDLPNLAEERTQDTSWLEEHTIEPDFDTQGLPIEESAAAEIDDILPEREKGAPLSELIVNERRQ